MPTDADLPPPHVLAIHRLSMLTTRGAPAQQVENQIIGMLAAWTTELGGNRTEFRDRLNGLEESLQAGLEQIEGSQDGIKGEARPVVERQIVALRTALDAIRQAQERLGA